MTAEGNAVQDRLGETTDHVTGPSPALAPRAGAPFVYSSGAHPLAGYTIKRGVGAGGFGEVYYAVSDAGKDVALKLIRRNLDTELRGMKQCLNLKHPNLVSLYDIRVDDSGDTWIVMEYVSGKSLEAVLADHPQGLPVDEALAWFRGIASGVAYLHDHGIVHRDLKPGNIFSDEGIVKVGDYGLSKFISCSRRSGHTESIGTVHYMAPEVAHGRYGKELDIYALGAVLYELLTGHVPFEGESVGEVLMKHLTAQADVSWLADPYRTAVARALDKDPARRFASVGEMLAVVCGAAASRNIGQPAEAGAAIPRANTAPTPVPPPMADRMTSAGPRATPFAQPAPMHIPGQPLGDTDEEPIARAVRQGLAELRHTWQNANLPTWLRRLLVVIGVIMLLSMGHLLIQLAVCLTLLYFGYWIVRRLYLSMFAPPSRRPAVPRPTATQPQAAAGQTGISSAMPAYIVKPPLVRLRELVGSMLAAAAVAAMVCVVAVLIMAYNNNSPVQPEQCAWLFVVGLAGTWVVLVAGKQWEGAEGEAMLRRFLLMAIGLGLGLLAYGLAGHFRVHLQPDDALAMSTGLKLPPDFYRDGQPQPMAYMAVFATLLSVPLRWWRQSDPLRATRISLVWVVMTVVVAHIVAIAWQFPEPWLMMVAGCMSVSVQLASPWVPTYARLKPQRKRMI
jgi:hypothetical protein